MTGNRDSLAAVPIAERVSAGVDLLDRERPGWDKKINLNTLNLRRCVRCVLGQLFGEYGDGLDELELSTRDSVRLGFDIHPQELNAVYDELPAAWMNAIRTRRQVVARG